MKNPFIKRSAILTISLILLSTAAFSQLDNINYLRSVSSDGVKYLQEYIKPWANSFGAGLGSGWYNTAKPHKLGGFDITVNVSAGVAPKSAETFDVSKIGLTSLTGTGTASTAAGPKTVGPLMSYKVNNVTLASFNAPKGTGWRYTPVPTAQIGIGLPLGTELKFRYIPKIKIDKGNISLWGVGIMHSLMQYVPGHKVSPLDVSLFAGYTNLKSDIPVSLDPDPSVAQNYTAPYNTADAFANQLLKVNVKALNVSAVASITLPVISFYGGVGYSKTRTTMDFSGNFPTPVLVTPTSGTPHAEYNNSGVKKGSDFSGMDIKNFSGLKANIGFRLKLSVITIHADYTRAQYDVLTTGLGISFR